MQFRTPIETPSQKSKPIHYQDQLFLIGSCFTQHIGLWLEKHFFQTTLNPFGIQYNPISIAQSLHHLIDNKIYEPQSMLHTSQGFRHYDFHSDYAAPQQANALQIFNKQIQIGREALLNCTTLLVTFGTAYVYTLHETQQVVSNCHKQPDRLFDRSRASVQTIVDTWVPLIDTLLSNNPSLHIIFTVSPIRHIKDTLHGNQLSKSTLLLAIDELQTRYPAHVDYFPAYEMLMDDLRDYRFYAEDMLHPSAQAVSYIQERFSEWYFETETQALFLKCHKISQALHHKPSDKEAAAYKQFLSQNIQKLIQLNEKYPYFRNEKALKAFQERL